MRASGAIGNAVPDPSARPPNAARPETTPPSLGPPSIPYVPPPTLAQMVLRSRLQIHARQLVGRRIANVGALLYIVAIPLSVAAIKAAFERSEGRSYDWPVFFGLLLDTPYAPLVGFIIGIDLFLLSWTFAAGHFMGADRPNAFIALLAGGVIGIAFHIVYLPYLESLVGAIAGLLSVVGGIYAIGRPLPGEWSRL